MPSNIKIETREEFIQALEAALDPSMSSCSVLPTTENFSSQWNFFMMLRQIEQLRDVLEKDTTRIYQLSIKVKGILRQIYGNLLGHIGDETPPVGSHERIVEVCDFRSGGGDIGAADSNSSLATLCKDLWEQLDELHKNNTNPLGMHSVVWPIMHQLNLIKNAVEEPFTEDKYKRLIAKAVEKLEGGWVTLRPGTQYSTSINQASWVKLQQKVKQKADNQPWINAAFPLLLALANHLVWAVDPNNRWLGLDDEVLVAIQRVLNDLPFPLTTSDELVIPQSILQIQLIASFIRLGMAHAKGKLSRPDIDCDFVWWRAVADYFTNLSRLCQHVSSKLGVTFKSFPLVQKVFSEMTQAMIGDTLDPSSLGSLAAFYLGFKGITPCVNKFGPLLSVTQRNAFPTGQQLLVGLAVSLGAISTMHAYDYQRYCYPMFFFLTPPVTKTFGHLYEEIASLLWMSGVYPARFTVFSTVIVTVLASCFSKGMVEIEPMANFLELFISLSPVDNPDLYEIWGCNPFIGFMVGIVYSQFAVVLFTAFQAYKQQGLFYSIIAELLKNPAFYVIMFMALSRMSMFYCQHVDTYILDECHLPSTAKAFKGRLTVLFTAVFPLKELGVAVAAFMSGKDERMSILLESLIMAVVPLIHCVRFARHIGCALLDNSVSSAAGKSYQETLLYDSDVDSLEHNSGSSAAGESQSLSHVVLAFDASKLVLMTALSVVALPGRSLAHLAVVFFRSITGPLCVPTSQSKSSLSPQSEALGFQLPLWLQRPVLPWPQRHVLPTPPVEGLGGGSIRS